MNRFRTGLISAVAAAGVVTLSACSDMSSASTVGGAPMGQPGHVMLEATTIAGLGSVIVDAAGNTLYRYDKDVAQPSMSNCDGACATTWPPVLATATPMLDGVDQGMVGTVVRKDGSKQLTLNGWPLYEFSNDKAPGQANGQGVNGAWFAVTPAGGKAQLQGGGAPEQAPADGGSGY